MNIRGQSPVFSPCFLPAESAETVTRVLSVSVERIPTGNFDLSKTYTYEFVAQP
jgi:hypothetical protein